MIYLRDHVPPHVHAFLGSHEALISIATGEVLQGMLPRSKLRAVLGWLHANREQIAYVWDETRKGRYEGGMIP